MPEHRPGDPLPDAGDAVPEKVAEEHRKPDDPPPAPKGRVHVVGPGEVVIAGSSG